MSLERSLKGEFEKLCSWFSRLLSISTVLAYKAYALDAGPNFTLTDVDGKKFRQVIVEEKVFLWSFSSFVDHSSPIKWNTSSLHQKEFWGEALLSYRSAPILIEKV